MLALTTFGHGEPLRSVSDPDGEVVQVRNVVVLSGGAVDVKLAVAPPRLRDCFACSISIP